MRRRGGSERPVKGPRANTKARKASIAAPSVANLQKQIGILTRELKEAREQQTASAEVLQVINSSFGNLARVFDAMLDKALGLCGAAFGILWTYDGAEIHAAALRGVPPAYAKFLTRSPHVVGHNNAHDRLMRGERIVHIVDAAQDEAYRSGDILRRATVELGGSRTLIAVPLRKDGMFLGDFVIYRQEVSPFSDKQIALLENFAAQAVIAMENARLFGELRERAKLSCASLSTTWGMASRCSTPRRGSPRGTAISRRCWICPMPSSSRDRATSNISATSLSAVSTLPISKRN
jgi:transcriptional regulator with GAF, ATPase, and Fis domain